MYTYAEDMHTGFWWGNTTKTDHLEDPGVDEIILKLIFKKCNGGHGVDGSGSGQGQVEGFCKCGTEPSGSIKCGEFLD